MIGRVRDDFFPDFAMKERLKITVNRRDLLRVVMTGAAVAATPTSAVEAAAQPESRKDKRKARYQASSAEVQDFYRVNRYPR